MAKKVSTKSPPIEHWQEMVSVYFDFCKKKFDEKPSFDGSAPKDLKAILVYLRARCIDKGGEWTLRSASERLGSFLEAAYNDNWLRSHWLLPNINRQKDQIVFNARQKATTKTGSSRTSGLEHAINQAIGAGASNEF